MPSGHKIHEDFSTEQFKEIGDLAKTWHQKPNHRYKAIAVGI